MSPGYKSLLQVVLILGVLGIGLYALYYFFGDRAPVTEVQFRNSGQQDSPGNEDPQTYRMVTLLPKDAIPAILHPQFISAEEVSAMFWDQEQVIGVSINGESRAYPIDTLSNHEIVYDVVGGEPIAVTW